MFTMQSSKHSLSLFTADQLVCLVCCFRVLGVAIISVMAFYGAGALVDDNDVVNNFRGGDFLGVNICAITRLHAHIVHHQSLDFLPFLCSGSENTFMLGHPFSLPQTPCGCRDLKHIDLLHYIDQSASLGVPQ